MVFTGLVQYVGQAQWVGEGVSRQLHVSVSLPVASVPKVGDSVAIDGVCLTASALPAPADGTMDIDTVLAFDVHPETLARTTLGLPFAPDSPWPVHVELAATQLGGHVVYGHVHGTAYVRHVATAASALRMWVGLSPALVALDRGQRLREKGAIALDGVSLTIVTLGAPRHADDACEVEVALIPHTLEHTTLGRRIQAFLHNQTEWRVNVELDMTAPASVFGEDAAVEDDDVLSYASLVARGMAVAMEEMMAVTRDTPPEPAVGAALVDMRTSVIVASGATGVRGVPHAEEVAFQELDALPADPDARYLLCVTLEPCHDQHAGGPAVPCVAQILARRATIARVVFAMEDPDPRESGRGAAALRAGGMECRQLAADDPQRVIIERTLRAHTYHRRTGRAYVTALAVLLPDGTGVDPMVVSNEARVLACETLADAQALVTTANTIVMLPWLAGQCTAAHVQCAYDSSSRLVTDARAIREAPTPAEIRALFAPSHATPERRAWVAAREAAGDWQLDAQRGDAIAAGLGAAGVVHALLVVSLPTLEWHMEEGRVNEFLVLRRDSAPAKFHQGRLALTPNVTLTTGGKTHLDSGEDLEWYTVAAAPHVPADDDEDLKADLAYMRRPHDTGDALDRIPTPRMATADEAIAAVSRGEIVIVCDDEDRENECDFIAAGWLLTEDDMAQFIRATTGIICAVMSAERAHILGLPLQAQLLAAAGMAPADGPFASTGFTVSVDSTAVTTGVSAMERLRTIQALGDAAIKPTQLRRGTGHVFPLIARAGGLRERRGHTEAAYMLATAAAERVAYTGPVIGVLAELRARNGHGMMRRDKAAKVAAKHKLVMTTVEALAQWQAAQDKARIKPARPLASCVLPLTLADGTVSEGWEMHCFASDSADPHRALVLGKAALVAAVAAQTPAILVRVHSDCWWGDVLGSARCDCGVQLRLAQARIHAAGCGILIFPAGHEGRGIGLVHKTRAYATTTLAAEAAAERLGEEEQGLTTYEANVAIGQPADARDYACVVPILRALGLGDSSVHLLTGNPAKVAALGSLVACVEALVVPPTTHSAAYLQQKAAWHANGSVLPAAEGKTEEEKKQ